MASGLCCLLLLAVCVYFTPAVSADDCKAFYDYGGEYHPAQECYSQSCCGSCANRFCCRSSSFLKFTEEKQEECESSAEYHNSTSVPMVASIVGAISVLLMFICCCICPCCCLYKMCRKPQPVIATTTHTTVVTGTPQHYPRQQTATPTQPQYPAYQPVPVQPGYGTQAMPQPYGPQPMPPAPYQAQPFVPGPPPSYQEATGPCYPPNPMPYSQAAFAPDQLPYPLHPPAQPGPSAPTSQTDFLSQPAYNPDFMMPKTG